MKSVASLLKKHDLGLGSILVLRVLLTHDKLSCNCLFCPFSIKQLLLWCSSTALLSRTETYSSRLNNNSQSGSRDPPRACKINLWGREIINRKRNCYSELCFFLPLSHWVILHLDAPFKYSNKTI